MADTPGSLVSNSAFLAELAKAAPAGSTLWVNAFVGAPGGEHASWGGRPFGTGVDVDTWGARNSYFSVAALRPDGNGEVKRRRANFARLLALVVDDVQGELKSSPSWILETSPGKRQVGIFLDPDDERCSDQRLVDALVTSMVRRGLLGADKGGNNAVRYVRLPCGQNHKEGGPYDHRLLEWNPGVRYGLDDAADLIGVNLEEVEANLLTTAGPPATGTIDAPQDEKLRLLTSSVILGSQLHDSLNEIAASVMASGMHPGAATNLLRGLMEASLAPKDQRWLDRYNDIPRAVSTAEKFYREIPLATYAPAEPAAAEPLLMSVDSLIENLEAIQWLVEGYMETDALSMMFGPPAGGKSFVAVSLGCCVATGTPWHGQKVERGLVVYVAGEGKNGLARRLAAWQKQTGVSLKGAPFAVSRKAIQILDEAEARALSEEIEALSRQYGMPVRLVIVDTVARNFGNGDENKQQDAGRFIQLLDELVRHRFRANVLMVHHSTKGDAATARGSSAFKGAVDQEINIVPGSPMRLEVTKMKEASLPPPIEFELEDVELGLDSRGEEVSSAAIVRYGNPMHQELGKTREKGEKEWRSIKVVDVFRVCARNWQPHEQLARELRCSEGLVRKMVEKLKSLGLIEKAGKGYKASEAGLKAYSHVAGMVSDKLNGEAAISTADPREAAVEE